MREKMLAIAALLLFGAAQNVLLPGDNHVPAGAAKLADDDVSQNVLWLVQAFGTADAADPAHDSRTKSLIAAALRKGSSLTKTTAEGLMAPETFVRLAGDDGELDAIEIQKQLDESIPKTRRSLDARLASHAKSLTAEFDQIAETHRESSKALVDWIVKNYEREKPLSIIFVCTGNSRRSVISATMANVAAAYYGLSEIRSFSGGTKPSAVNERTIATLQKIGVEFEKTNKEAEPGPESAANPIYRIRFGERLGEIALEATEFSKHFGDAHNPQKGFAAVMVCSEADESCPTVKGADVRISMAFVDPKLDDGKETEARTYAARRDEIGRLMLAIMMQARLGLVSAGKLP